MPMSLGSTSFVLGVMLQQPVYRDMGDGLDSRKKKVVEASNRWVVSCVPDPNWRRPARPDKPDVGRFQRRKSARVVWFEYVPS